MAVAGFAFSDEFAGAAVGGSTTPVPTGPGEAQVVGSDYKIIQFAAAVGVPNAVAEAVLDVLGDPDLTLEDFAYIDDEEYHAVVGSFTIGGNAAGPIHKAQAKKLMAKARATVLNPTSSIASNAPPPVAPVAPAVSTHLKISSFVDQSSEMVFPLLTPDQLSPHRAKYDSVFHVPPPLNQRPTDEQLSALKALLATGRTPYVDFAIFGPFDEVEAKHRKFTEQVFVDGALQTRLLHGPSSYTAWEACWKVYRSAMIMLDQASIGALDAYAEGIRQLVLTYSEWGCISRADVTMRSVQWSIVKEEMSRTTPPGYDATKPWDYIIARTAFGAEGPRAHWWWLSVVGPLSAGGAASSSGPALARVDRLEGRAHQEQPAKKQKGTGGNVNNNFINSGVKSKGSSKGVAKEICYDWNNGTCVDGPCPNGRLHICRFCKAPHRGNGCTKNPSKGNNAQNTPAKRKNKARSNGKKSGGKGSKA